MASVLHGAIGADREKLAEVIEQLEAFISGRRTASFYVGLNEHAISVSAGGVLLHDEYLDLDLQETKQGLPASHEDLRDGLAWWKDVVDRWWAGRIP